MPARRIIAVTVDEGLGRQLGAALPEIELFRDVASVPPVEPGALWVVHLAADHVRLSSEIVSRIAGAPVIAVLPKADLVAVVELMEDAPQVVAVVAAEDLDAARLRALADRALGADGFGLAKLMAPGTQIHSITVGEHEDKLRCMAQIAAFVEQLGVPVTRSASIEQCLDEMLMNALYDAPVDANGQHVFKGVPTSERITRRTGHEVVVEYAADGARFAIAVRDAFGSLARHTVVGYLHKGLHAENKVDRKAGGAGLGLFLMANASTAVLFNVVPDVASEAVCMFALGTGKPGLAQLGFFVQADPAGRARSAPARVRLAGPAARRRRTRILVTAAAVAATAAAAAIVVPRLLAGPPSSVVAFTTMPPGATIEIDGRAAGIAGESGLVLRDLTPEHTYAVTARLDDHEPATTSVTPPDGTRTVTLTLQALPIVELDTKPTDAAVEIDGKPVGSTPLRLTNLTVGKTVAIAFTKRGYRRASASLRVPERGARQELVQPLTVDEDLVRVRFVSTPMGAEVIKDGKPPGTDRTYTPAEVFVEAGTPQHFTLTMPHHVPVEIEPFVVERGQQGLEKGGTLVEGATLRIEAARPGKASVVGAPHCKDVALPFDCTLAPGTYTVELVGQSTKREVFVGASDYVVRFD